MINLEDYIQLQETENLLFEDDMIHILVGTDLNDFDYKRLYNENYKNAGCISGAYNGELLGYRIIIYFVDGTSMYYDEAVE